MRSPAPWLTLALLLSPLATAPAQTTKPAGARAAAPEPLDVLKGRTDTPGGNDAALGEPFESVADGIKFRPPANMKRATRRPGADFIVRYTDDGRGWALVATRSSFDRPIALTTQLGDPGAPLGLLERTRDELKENAPGAEVVREDVIEVGDYPVGMLAARYSLGLKRFLSQQAIVRADDRTYYTLSLTTPAARQGEDGKTPEGDPEERRAVDAFRAAVDTVQLLDRTPVLDDQRERLIRTRALFVNLTAAKLRNAIASADGAEPEPKTRQDGKHEMFLRILQDGKDVGYTYVVENEEKRGAMEGVSVGVRSRTTLAAPAAAPKAAANAAPANVDANPNPNAGAKPAAAASTTVKTDAESLMWMSFDRRHETWRTLTVIDDGKDHSTEIGASDRQVERVLDKDLPVGEKRDERNPPVRDEQVYTLTVTTASTKVNAEPLTRLLPPFYLPQALVHLLPRLVPLNEPKTYMFASYVGEAREVMSRYVDVGPEQNVQLGGKQHVAVPVKDRVGLQGSVTTHWLTAHGTYLGSTNEDSKVTILPSDEPALRKIWADAKLTAPEPAKDGPGAASPGGANDGGGGGIPKSDSRGNLQPAPAGGR